MQKTKVSSFIATFLLCYAFWILLTWKLNAQELIAGAVVSAAAAAFSARFFIHVDAFHMLKPKRIIALAKYVGVFIVELCKANWAVAKICLTGCKDVDPGIVRVPVDLKGLYPKAMLANSITLTPGTMTLDIASDQKTGQSYYYIHWIKVESEDENQAGEMIKGRLEKAVKEVWE